MMAFLPSFWAHLSFGLVITSGLWLVLDRVAGPPASCPLPQRQLAVVLTFAMALAAGYVPVGDVDCGGWLLAFSGELSFTSTFLLGCSLAHHGRFNPLARPGRIWGRADRAAVRDVRMGAAWLAWPLLGLVLYGTVLGGLGPDVYSWGFKPWLAWGLLSAAAVSALSGRWLAAWMLLGIVLAWLVAASGATNIWDYAIDPFVVVGVIIAAVTGESRHRRRDRIGWGS